MSEWVDECEVSRVTMRVATRNGLFPSVLSSAYVTTEMEVAPIPISLANLQLLRALQLSFFHSFLALPWVSVAAGNPIQTSELMHPFPALEIDTGMGLTEMLLTTQVPQDTGFVEVISFCISCTSHPVEFFQLNTASSGRMALICKTVLQVVKIILLIILYLQCIRCDSYIITILMFYSFHRKKCDGNKISIFSLK